MSESLIGGLLVGLIAGLLWRSRGALSWDGAVQAGRLAPEQGSDVEHNGPTAAPSLDVGFDAVRQAVQGIAHVCLDCGYPACGSDTACFICSGRRWRQPSEAA